MTITGKAFHIGIDLVLFSGFLAGIKRNTGLTLNLDPVDDKYVKQYAQKYLNVGEYFYDTSVAYFGGSDYFTRK